MSDVAGSAEPNLPHRRKIPPLPMGEGGRGVRATPPRPGNALQSAKRQKQMIQKDQRAQHLRRQLQQLILLRETGPKSAAWHAARSRMIWRLHDEIKHEQGEPMPQDSDEQARQV